MSKRQAKKAAYKAIVKEGKSHQECYDSLRKEIKINAKDLAEEISKIPSTGKTNETATLRTFYLIILGIIIVLRALGAISLTEGNFELPMILLFVAVGVVFPAYGIYGSVTRRIESYRSIAIILGLGIMRSFTRDAGEHIGPETLYVLIPFVAAIALALYIPTKLKTPYTTTMSQVKMENGKTRNVVNYTFEDTRAVNDDILDSSL